MNLAIVLVVTSVLALGIILRLAIKGSLQLKRSGDPTVSVCPIDIEAFRNLIDPGEEDYLRRRLPPGDFRAVRRERLRAMAAYIRVAGSNATVLARAAETAFGNADAATAQAAQALLGDALLLRRNSAYALVQIYVALAWPGMGLAGENVLTRYERMSGSAMLLSRLQNPGVPVRLSAR